MSTNVEGQIESPNSTKPVLGGAQPEQSLPITNAQFFAILEKFMVALKNAAVMEPRKAEEVDWKELEDEWCDWLEDMLGSDCT